MSSHEAPTPTQIAEAVKGVIKKYAQEYPVWFKRGEQESIDGFTNVLTGNPRWDHYEYDYYDPGLRYIPQARERIDEYVTEIENILGPQPNASSQWRRFGQNQEYRVITYRTILPNLKLRHTEYRYPGNPEWGTCVRREITRPYNPNSNTLTPEF